MVNRSLVRKKSLMLLAGKLLPAMLLALIAEVITLAVSFFESAAYKAFNIVLPTTEDLLTAEDVDAYLSQFLSDKWLLVKILGVVAVGALISFVVSAPLRFGTLRWYRAAARNNPQTIGYALNSYGTLKEIGHSLAIYIYTGLQYLKWGVAIFAAPIAVSLFGSFIYEKGKEAAAAILIGIGLIIAVAAVILFIFVTNRYFLAPYIYADGDISVVEAVRESKRRMRGQEKDLLVFMLTLVPIILISYLLCYGAASIIVFPFVYMCLAVYATELTDGSSEQKNDDIEYTVE